MKKTKILIDVLLLIVTILLTSIDKTGRLAHEILGISMAILLIIHIFLNWNWVKQIPKNFKKVIMFIHIGMHLDRMFIKVKSEKLKRFLYCIYIVIAILVSIYSIYTLTHSYQWMYMFGTQKW